MKNWGKFFCFSDINIWIGCSKLFLLKREYLSLAVNVFTKFLDLKYVKKKKTNKEIIGWEYLWSADTFFKKCLKILHIIKRDFSELSCLHSDQ